MGKGKAGATVVEIIIAILLPPLGVFLRYACGVRIFLLEVLFVSCLHVLDPAVKKLVHFGSVTLVFSGLKVFVHSNGVV